jgi:carbonic anhydrase
MKLSRRAFCACIAGAVPLIASSAQASSSACEIFTPDRQAAISPQEAIERLVDGNRRFVGGHAINCDLRAQVRDAAAHQAPFAAVVGCIDSRVPPELVFDQRIGDIFCARVAGNFVNGDILGSLEYSTKVAGAKAIVVLGHSGCGAIKSTLAGVEMGNITGMLANIAPALSALSEADGAPDAANKHQLAKVTEANVRLTVDAIMERSDVIRALVDAGEVKIVGAVNDVATGEVAWLA